MEARETMARTILETGRIDVDQRLKDIPVAFDLVPDTGFGVVAFLRSRSRAPAYVFMTPAARTDAGWLVLDEQGDQWPLTGIERPRGANFAARTGLFRIPADAHDLTFLSGVVGVDADAVTLQVGDARRLLRISEASGFVVAALVVPRGQRPSFSLTVTSQGAVADVYEWRPQET
jgi:hypothetical protein